MGNGRKQEKHVAQDAEVDLLQRGKFKAGGKLLFPRKDDGTCGKRMCCFCKAERCTKPDDVPSCIEQGIYYLDYWNRKSAREDGIGKCLEGMFERHPILLQFTSGMRDAALNYISSNFKTKRSWLFDTVTAGWKHFNMNDGVYDSFSLLFLAMEFASSTEAVCKVFECTAKHIYDNLDSTLECMDILRRYYARCNEGGGFGADEIEAIVAEKGKAKSEFAKAAFNFCLWATERAFLDTDKCYFELFFHLGNLSYLYDGLLKRMSSRYCIGRVFMDGFARALREIYVDSTPKQIMLSMKKEA